MQQRWRAAGVLAAVSLVVSAPALAAPPPGAGLDCGCAKVGAYVLPVAPRKPLGANALTTLSPHGTYSVAAEATPGFPQPARVTVTRVADGAVLVAGADASDWGFSPDDDRLLLASREFGGAPATVALLDLSVVPAVRLAQFQPSTLGSALSFSPHGRWLVELELSLGGTYADLRVLDASTGAQAFSDSFLFTTSPGSAGDKVGAVAVGFGPDAADRTLTYAYLTGATTTRWSAVNLETRALVVGQDLGAAFSWGFSPCGDAVGAVTDAIASSLKSAQVHPTLALGLLGTFGPFPATDSADLSVTAASHLLVHNGSTEVLAGNGAGAACPAPPANAPPVAAFSAPAAAFSLLPVQFNDQSHDADGRVVAWQWTFGDGQGAALRSPSHTYLSGGNVTVVLTVTDDRGATGTVSHTLALAANQPPDAGFTATPDPPSPRQLVTLTDVSTDDDGVVSREWTVDGLSLTGPEVTARACPPSMQVYLSVTDHAGQGSSISREIAVDGGNGDVPVPAGADLAAAIAGACPGDRLVLAPGHYAGGVRLPPRFSLAGAGMGVSFVDGAAADPEHWVLQAGTDLTISDLTISDGGTSAPGLFQWEAGGGLRLLGGKPQAGPTRVSQVEVAHNVGNGGIWIEDHYGNPVEISGARVHHNRRDNPNAEGSGLDMFCCATVTVDHSEFTANTSLFGSGPVFLWEATRVVFTSNDVHDNEGLALSAESMSGGGRPPGEVSLNRFVGNTGAGLELGGTFVVAGNLVARNGGVGLKTTSRQVTVVNSTIADNAGNGLEAPLAVVWNSIVTGNLSDQGGDPAAGGANLIGGDAGFLGGGDYHLAPGSPARGQGDPAAVPASLTNDADGDLRVVSVAGGPAQVDLGWDQATAGAPVDAGAASDGGVPDAGAPDAGALDGGQGAGGGGGGGAGGGQAAGGGSGGAGGGGAGPGGGCGCSAGTDGLSTAALLGALRAGWRRRRPGPSGSSSGAR